MIVGCSQSGQDLSMELVEVAKDVYLSTKSLKITEGLSKVISKHENLHLRPQVLFQFLYVLKVLFLPYENSIETIMYIFKNVSPIFL